MNILEILLISIGLAMDAFSVAICKGLAMKKMSYKGAIIVGSYFGIFQALMPLIGYFLGIRFENIIVKVDHWIAFILLLAIGINMIKESFESEKDNTNDSIDFKTMVILAIATSIDALAAGITFACLRIKILIPIISIGTITFILSVIGVKIGNKFGEKYKNKAVFLGGIILIFIGTKILLEHLGLLH